MSDDAVDVLDGDLVVDPCAPDAPKRLTPPQRKIARLAKSIQEEVSTAVMGGETVEELRKRLDWAKKTRPAGEGIWRRSTILALATTGMTPEEIAGLVDVSVATIRHALYDMRKAGIGVDTAERLDFDIVPAAINKLYELVQAGDKDAVFAVLKGRGAFRQHVASDGQRQGPMTVLAVKFEMPPGTQPALVGTVVGAPRGDT